MQIKASVALLMRVRVRGRVRDVELLQGPCRNVVGLLYVGCRNVAGLLQAIPCYTLTIHIVGTL